MPTPDQLLDIIFIQSEIARHDFDPGGDEFGVILVPVDLPDGIDAALQRLSHAIAPPCKFENRVCQLRASIGAATFPDDGADINALVETAEKRERHAKRA